MARASKRVCGEPGCPRIQPAAWCPTHARERERHRRRTTPTKVTRDRGEQERRAKAVAEHVVSKGYWCPGIGRPPHTSVDLTAGHIPPIGRGGDPRGPLIVFCRSCNSRQGARF